MNNTLAPMRDLFHVSNDFIYLNSGSASLTPNEVLTFLSKTKTELETNPTESLFGAWKRLWSTQQSLAQFIKADPHHLFLRPNVTFAMNDFLMAIQLPPQSEILASDLEYGGIVKICEHKCRMENHSLRKFSFYEKGAVTRTLTEEDLLNRLADEITPKTKMVMLSHVMTGTGLVLPVEKIAAFLRDKHILFACDGAHGAGILPLDFSRTKIDFYGSNLHKWLMGPKGTGFGFISPEVREKLVPQFAGWTTGEILPHFQVFAKGDGFAQRWMICSTVNFADYYGIPPTIEFWNRVGAEKIRLRQNELIKICTEMVVKKTGWRSVSDYAGSLLGPMTAFHLPRHQSSRGFGLMDYLFQKQKLVVSMTMIQGDWCLRVSPHVYTSEEEISRAAEILGELK